MRPYNSRRSSGYQIYSPQVLPGSAAPPPPLVVPNDPYYPPMEPVSGSYIVYPQVNQYGGLQYQSVQQQPQGHVINTPTTPFDTAYGATLLPSHLLINSPFVSSPAVTVVPSHSGRQQQHVLPQQLLQQQQPYYYRHFSVGQGRASSQRGGRTMRRSHSKSSNASERSTPGRLSSVSLHGMPLSHGGVPRGRSEGYPFPGLLDVNQNMGESEEYIQDLFTRPISISFKILPKGDDAHRTRSILFENVSEPIDISAFIANFVKTPSIESIYVLPSSVLSQVEQTDDSEKTPKGEDRGATEASVGEKSGNADDDNAKKEEGKEGHDTDAGEKVGSEGDRKSIGILLSFLTPQIALDVYNKFLQRFQEIKKRLNSDGLSMKFVAMRYSNETFANPLAGNVEAADLSTTERGVHGYNSNGLPISLQRAIIGRNASRSIILEFDEPRTKEELFDTDLKFLINKQDENTRYILESVDIVDASEPKKDLNKNYVILTFINIFMAIEILDYVESHLELHNVVRCGFAAVSMPSEGSHFNSKGSKRNSPVGVSSNSNGSELGSEQEGSNQGYFGIGSVLSLNSSSSSMSINGEKGLVLGSFDTLDLAEIKLTVDYRDYPAPHTEHHSKHLPNVTMVQQDRFEPSMGTPRAQELYVADAIPFTSMSPSISSIEEPSVDSHRLYSTSSMVSGNGTFLTNTPVYQPQYIVDQPFFKPRGKLHPITDSLEDQLTASARIASATGGDLGNRTIYIGNINPRSKVEDICNVVRGGILQSIKYIESKHICFVTFIEASAAVQFYANTFIDPIVLHGNTLKLGWGNHSGPLPKSIALAVTIGASRNVYVSLPEMAFKDKFMNTPEYEQYHEKYKLPTSAQLRKDFTTYGPVEQINYLSDSHCCWVNFLNISSAIKLVEDSTNERAAFNEKFEGRYEGLIISYGKDRCGNVNRSASRGGRYSRRHNHTSSGLSRLEERRRTHEIEKRQGSLKAKEKDQSDSADISLGSEKEMRDTNESTVIRHNAEVLSDEHRFMNLDSLGLTLNTNVGSEKSIDQAADSSNEQDTKVRRLAGTGERELEKEDGKEDGDVEGKGDVPQAAGELNTTSHNSDDSDIDSDSSSDVEFILSSPTEREAQEFNNGSQRILSGSKPAKPQDSANRSLRSISNTSSLGGTPGLVNTPPLVGYPSSQAVGGHGQVHRTRQYPRGQMAAYTRGKGRGHSQRHIPGNFINDLRKQNSTAIPGSDVMAQYLAQLQHSTFMYAANILGASAEDVDRYERGGP